MAISGWGIFLILLVVVVILAAIAYVLYAHYRANKLGLPPPNLNPFARGRGRRQDPNAYRAPAPAPAGIQGWLADKWQSLRQSATGGGGRYESTGYGGDIGGGRSSLGERRGFGALDPDEAWDARVDHEMGAYYEEAELGGGGLQDPSHGPYGGGGYGASRIGVGGIEEGRGRSRSRQRELDARYDEEVHGARRADPFGDQAEPSDMSLRSVSPRPDGADVARQAQRSHKRGESHLTVGSSDNSPTERRSMFREDV